MYLVMKNVFIRILTRLFFSRCSGSFHVDVKSVRVRHSCFVGKKQVRLRVSPTLSTCSSAFGYIITSPKICPSLRLGIRNKWTRITVFRLNEVRGIHPCPNEHHRENIVLTASLLCAHSLRVSRHLNH